MFLVDDEEPVLDLIERIEIPLSVVREFDMMDDDDPGVPPQFSCRSLCGEMKSDINEPNSLVGS